jgi:thermopsin
MMRKNISLFVVTLMALSVLSTLGVVDTVAQTTGFSTAPVNLTLNTTEVLPANYYYYYNFSLPNTYPNATFGYYFSVSNTSVSTALMTSTQFKQFNTTGSFSGGYIADQNGTLNFDGLLFTQGVYYLVVYAYQAPAEVEIYLSVKSNMQAINATQYVGEFETIPAHQNTSIPLHYETLGSPFNITVFGISNQTVKYTIWDNSTQTPAFTSPLVTFTNLSIQPLSYNYTLTNLRQGVYTLIIGNPHNSPAYVYFEYHIYPKYVNPYLRLQNGAPTGLAAYGVLNQSGTPTPYLINTSSVLGYANISSILAYNQTAAQQANLQDPYMASLQLNLVLGVENSDGSYYFYWPQNVPRFYTDKQLVQLSNNVFNMSGDGAYLTNSSITSPNGVVIETQNGGVTQYYYGNYLNQPIWSYRLPFAFVLLMNESVVQGQGVLISMGIVVVQNGTTVANPQPYWFDRIMIHDPAAAAAGFIVSGYRYTPAGAASLLGSYYDAELVFGGGANSEVTQFEQLSATLGLLYYSPATDNYTAFPSYYSFGADTAEATTDAHVSYLGSGFASVSVGTPDYTYLAENNLKGTQTTTATTSPTAPTSSAPSTAATTTQTSTTTPPNTQTTTSSSASTPPYTQSPITSSTSQGGSATAGAILLVIIIVIMVAAITALVRRRRH